MEEKSKKKLGLLTVLLFLAIIVIIIMGIFMNKIQNEKVEESKKAAELQTQVDNLNEKIDNISNIVNANNFTDNEKQNKELSESEKQEIFNKAVKNQTVFIDTMISNKDFGQKNFSDKEMILMLPDSSEGKIFKSYEDDGEIYGKASITDVEKSAKKVFGKEVNVIKAVQNNNSIKVDNEDVMVEVRSGVGILNAKLISIESVDSNEYTINFEFSSSSDDTYKLTVEYENGNVVYKSLEI